MIDNKGGFRLDGLDGETMVGLAQGASCWTGQDQADSEDGKARGVFFVKQGLPGVMFEFDSDAQRDDFVERFMKHVSGTTDPLFIAGMAC